MFCCGQIIWVKCHLVLLHSFSDIIFMRADFLFFFLLIGQIESRLITVFLPSYLPVVIFHGCSRVVTSFLIPGRLFPWLAVTAVGGHSTRCEILYPSHHPFCLHPQNNGGRLNLAVLNPRHEQQRRPGCSGLLTDLTMNILNIVLPMIESVMVYTVYLNLYIFLSKFWQICSIKSLWNLQLML